MSVFLKLKLVCSHEQSKYNKYKNFFSLWQSGKTYWKGSRGGGNMEHTMNVVWKVRKATVNLDHISTPLFFPTIVTREPSSQVSHRPRLASWDCTQLCWRYCPMLIYECSHIAIQHTQTLTERRTVVQWISWQHRLTVATGPALCSAAFPCCKPSQRTLWPAHSHHCIMHTAWLPQADRPFIDWFHHVVEGRTWCQNCEFLHL